MFCTARCFPDFLLMFVFACSPLASNFKNLAAGYTDGERKHCEDAAFALPLRVWCGLQRSD